MFEHPVRPVSDRPVWMRSPTHRCCEPSSETGSKRGPLHQVPIEGKEHDFRQLDFLSFRTTTAAVAASADVQCRRRRLV